MDWELELEVGGKGHSREASQQSTATVHARDNSGLV